MKTRLPVRSVFVSYSTKDKLIGAQVKSLLEAYGVRCFLAHQDLRISEQWKACILAELQRCDAFVALLSKAFRSSDWAPQEVGVIVARGDVPILPLSVDGTIPFGFIAHVQSGKLRNREVRKRDLITPLRKLHPHLVIPGMIKQVAAAGTYRGAEAVLKPLVPLFRHLDQVELDALVEAAIKNSQVWSARDCRTNYLPKLIKLHGERMRPKRRRVLEYQLKHDTWYRET
jgi:hypothetical protein